MSDAFIHLIVPLLILLILINDERRKYVFVLLPFAIFPDLDLFVEHRALLHNIFIPLTMIIASIWTSKRSRLIILIASAYILSHIMLDIFNSGVYILYPVYNKTFLINIELMVSRYPVGLEWIVDWGFKDVTGAYSKWYDTIAISSTGIGIVTLSSALYFIKIHLKKMRL